jgi:hypothetical protein
MSSMNTFSPKSSKKRVAFAEYSSVVVTRCKTKEELESVWNTKAEMKAFRAKASIRARKIRLESPAAADEYIRNSFEVDEANIKFSGIENVVGIEHLLDEKVCQMLEVCKSLTKKRVLEEQRRQRLTGELNVGSLAQISASTSKFSILWRRRIAMMNGSNHAS